MKNKYIRLLQLLVGTDADGSWGPASCAAADQLIRQLEELRDQINLVLSVLEVGKE